MKKLAIDVRLSRSPNELTKVDHVLVNGERVPVTESHLSSARVCVHIDHPLIERVAFEQPV